MPRQTMRAASALLLGLTAGGHGITAVQAQEVPQAAAAAIRNGVQATLAAHGELSAAGRWEALMRLYADDPRFRWVSNGVVVARSVDEIRKYFSGLPAGSRVETTYRDTEIAPLAPGVALVETSFTTRMIDAKGGGFGFGGMLTMTLVERADGWKIIAGHSSSAPARQAP
jgi:ketosteroid isomerase-like protein